MAFNLIHKSQSFLVDNVPSTFRSLQDLAQEIFALNPEKHEILFVESQDQKRINEDVYFSLLQSSGIEKPISIEVILENETTQEEKEARKALKAREPEDAKLNAMMNALFALSILNPEIDVSKVLIGEESPKDKENIPKRKRSSLTGKYEKIPFKQQKSLIKMKKGRINQP